MTDNNENKISWEEEVEAIRVAGQRANGLFRAQMRIIDLEEAGASPEDIEREFGGRFPDDEED